MERFEKNLLREMQGKVPEHVDSDLDAMTPDRLDEVETEMRKKKGGQERKNQESKMKRHLKGLFDAYNVRSVHISLRDLPFSVQERSAYNHRVFNLIDEENQDAVYVDTGQMVLVRNDREAFTDGIQGCGVLFAQGERGKCMAHMISNEDSNEFGLLSQDKNRLAQSILENVQDIGEIKSISIVGREGVKYDDQELDDLRDALADRVSDGEVSVRRVPMDNLLVYHSPAEKDSLMIIGSEYSQEKGTVKKSMTVPLRLRN